jgi:hypothetical protein
MKLLAEAKMLRPTQRNGPMVISCLVLVAALFVILSQLYDDSVQKWAFGMVGMIVGTWLRRK